MDEQTTTESTATDTGAETAQPVQASENPAAQETTENQEQTTQPQAGESETTQTVTQPTEDDALTKFAQAKGLELDSENSKKAAKMAMEAEKLMHQATGHASELEKNLNTASDDYAEQVAQQTGQDPELLKRLQRVEVKEAVRDFWNTPDVNGNTPDKSLEPAMIELLGQKPHLAGDLDSLYATAMVKSGKFATAKSQGKREALESLAQRQQAAVPTGNATNSAVTSTSKPFESLSIAEMEAKLGFVKR